MLLFEVKGTTRWADDIHDYQVHVNCGVEVEDDVHNYHTTKGWCSPGSPSFFCFNLYSRTTYFMFCRYHRLPFRSSFFLASTWYIIYSFFNYSTYLFGNLDSFSSKCCHPLLKSTSFRIWFIVSHNASNTSCSLYVIASFVLLRPWLLLDCVH